MTTVDNNVMTGFSDQSVTSSIPFHLQCSHNSCGQFASFTVHPSSSSGKVVLCVDHVDMHQFVHINDIVLLDGTTVLSPGRESWQVDNSFSFIDNFRIFTLPAQIAQVIAVREALTLRRDAVSALENFKQAVVDTTVDWSAGCREGKTEFLEALGLSYPKKNVTITVTFEYEGDPNDISTYDVESCVNAAVDNSESMYIDIDWE